MHCGFEFLAQSLRACGKMCGLAWLETVERGRTMPVRVDRMFRFDRKAQENKNDARNRKTGDDAKSIIGPVSPTVQSNCGITLRSARIPHPVLLQMALSRVPPPRGSRVERGFSSRWSKDRRFFFNVIGLAGALPGASRCGHRLRAAVCPVAPRLPLRNMKLHTQELERRQFLRHLE